MKPGKENRTQAVSKWDALHAESKRNKLQQLAEAAMRQKLTTEMVNAFLELKQPVPDSGVIASLVEEQMKVPSIKQEVQSSMTLYAEQLKKHSLLKPLVPRQKAVGDEESKTSRNSLLSHRK